jgi:hypothetical protein
MTMTFEEKVRNIGKRQGSEDYNVIFSLKAAIYWIKNEKDAEIQILSDSAKTGSPVKITCDGLTREILEVKV